MRARDWKGSERSIVVRIGMPHVFVIFPILLIAGLVLAPRPRRWRVIPTRLDSWRPRNWRMGRTRRGTRRAISIQMGIGLGGLLGISCSPSRRSKRLRCGQFARFARGANGGRERNAQQYYVPAATAGTAPLFPTPAQGPVAPNGPRRGERCSIARTQAIRPKLLAPLSSGKT
jgi:hypothetical protein